MTRSLKLVSLMTLVLLWILLVAQPWGYVAARIACNDTGGLQVAQTFDTNAYFNATRSYDCYDCYDEIASRAFQYVDVYYERPANSGASRSSGYERYELLSAPDARCDWWYRSGRSRRAGSQYGLDDDQCIGRYPIADHEVARFESRQVRWTPVDGPLGIGLYMNELEIVDRASDQRVARARHYGFVNTLSRSLGSKSIMYKCGGEGSSVFNPMALRAAVLKDSRSARHDVPAAAHAAPRQDGVDDAIVADLVFSDDAVVHAVGVYRALPVAGRKLTYSARPDAGGVIVSVGGTGKIILVLSAHDPVRWIVQSQGAQVTQIVVFGFHEQQVVGADSSTEVYYNPELSSGNSRIYAYERDARYMAIEAAARELTGKPIQTFQGSYDVDRFIVRAGSGTRAKSKVTAIREWTGEDGVISFGDVPPDTKQQAE